MHSAHEFLKALAIVLCVAAVTTVLFQRLRQPVVLGYILAGLIVGPHVPIPLVADAEIVRTLSELGVILLMFSLGLEFSLRKLFEVGATAGLTAAVQCSFMLWIGFVMGRLFGWSGREALFAGSLVAISSTTIVAKAFDEQDIRGSLRQLVFGILIVEDLIAILLMAVLTAVSAGKDLGGAALFGTVGRLAAFLSGLVAIGLLVVPRAVRTICRLQRPETTLVASLGICFAAALLAQQAGYSVALGAFLGGALVAESGEGQTVGDLVRPVRDAFAAVFFVSVGMLIDPFLIARHWPEVAAFTAAVVLGQTASVTIGAFLSGNGVRTSVRAGMSLAQIGEFSFIIAGLGITLAATREFLYPIAVAVSALTTLTTPWFIRASGPTAAFLDRKLPRALQTFAALYGSWIEDLREAPEHPARAAGVRKLARWLALDAGLLGAVIIGAALYADRSAQVLEDRLGLQPTPSRLLVLAAALGLAAPFCAGIFRGARRLGFTLAEAALPSAREGKVDLAAAPRKAFVVTLQLAILLLVGTPLLAVTQPFLSGGQGAAALTAIAFLLGLMLWRSAENLQGHVRAGAQLIVEALAALSRSGEPQQVPEQVLARACEVLPGIGAPSSVRLRAGSPVLGKTLAQSNLRGLTGATVLAIGREAQSVTFPTASEVLQEGDVLALAGTDEAIEAAREVLLATDPS